MLSVVMPAYNERELLETSVRDVADGLRGWIDDFEVCIVENGSTDGTPAIADALAASIPEVRARHLPEPNYGNALRAGILDAAGDVVATFDVDYYDLHFLKQALTLLDDRGTPPVAGVAIVAASTRAAGARDERPLLRRVATAVFDAILHAVFGVRVSDTHGMKVLRRAPVRDLAEICRAGPDLFDTELLIRGEREGLGIEEVPVTVVERRPSRTSIVRRVPRTLVGLARLRLALGRAPR
jgi:glycosyltransferase involved in cell wall biosynthesis